MNRAAPVGQLMVRDVEVQTNFSSKEERGCLLAFGRTMRSVAAHNILVDIKKGKIKEIVLGGKLASSDCANLCYGASAVTCEITAICSLLPLLSNVGICPSVTAVVGLGVAAAGAGYCVAAQAVYSYERFLVDEIHREDGELLKGSSSDDCTVVLGQPRLNTPPVIEVHPEMPPPSYEQTIGQGQNDCTSRRRR